MGWRQKIKGFNKKAGIGAVVVLVLILIVSCQTCRKTSVEDAKYYQSLGYETRIVVYRVGVDGKLMGLGIWDFHAQAQVLVDGEWKWIDGGLKDHPAYSIGGEIYYWQPDIYEAVLKKHNAYN